MASLTTPSRRREKIHRVSLRCSLALHTWLLVPSHFLRDGLYFFPKEEIILKASKPWSRKRIVDEYSSLLKADGTPMSRQQIHMLRKKSRGICLTCGQPALGVYCAEHTVQARERMRKILHSKRRHWNSPSYNLPESARSKGRLLRIRPELHSHSHSRAA